MADAEGDGVAPEPAEADVTSTGAAAPGEPKAQDGEEGQEDAAAEAGDAAPATPASGRASQAPSEASSRRMQQLSPPESVRQWLKGEDWEALQSAWNDAEAKAICWAEGDMDDLDGELVFEDEDSSASVSLHSKGSRHKRRHKSSGGASSHGSVGGGTRRKPWNENFSQIATDSRRPPPLRRYFDETPAETSPPRRVRRSLEPLSHQQSRASEHASRSTMSSFKAPQPEWNEMWGSTASKDNDGIHRHLRHYFDRRGMEASFRMRPHTDSPWLQQMRPRTPEKPDQRTLLLKHSASAPAISRAGAGSVGTGGSSSSKESGVSRAEVAVDPLDVKERGKGSIRWGTRCMLYGIEAKSNARQQIPWVCDHHKSENEDNEIVHPALRHYFDADGLESSFRNRGRQYGRPLKPVLGISAPSKPTAPLSSGPPRRSAG